MRLKTGRIGTNKQPRERIKIRILRSWRGYGPGAIISPPAGARQILLSATDQLGRQIAEIVGDDAVGNRIAEVVNEAAAFSSPEKAPPADEAASDVAAAASTQIESGRRKK